MISQWIEAANHENQVENSEDEVFLNDDLINDFSVGTRNIHLADDQSAKWKLESLFVNNLEPPTYTGFFSAVNQDIVYKYVNKCKYNI